MTVVKDGCHHFGLYHTTLLVKVPVHAQEDEVRLEERRMFELDEPPCGLQGVEGSLNTEEMHISGIGKVFTRMDYVVYKR